jgi:drug/metabolite transporter (DMT)-like permease
MTWVLFVVQAVISSAGLILLRHSMPVLLDKTEPSTWSTYLTAGLGVIAYGSSFLLWLFILSRNPVSFAYPITIGLTLAVTVVGSFVILGEKISVFQIIGVVLMAAAVFLLSMGQPAAAAPPL